MNQKAKVPIFNQTSCQQEQEQRNTSTWPCRFAAGKKVVQIKTILAKLLFDLSMFHKQKKKFFKILKTLI